MELGQNLLRSWLKRAVYLVNNTSIASWMFLWGGVPGMSSQEETLRQTLDMLGVYFHLARRGDEGMQGRGWCRLYYAAPASQTQIND